MPRNPTTIELQEEALGFPQAFEALRRFPSAPIRYVSGPTEIQVASGDSADAARAAARSLYIGLRRAPFLVTLPAKESKGPWDATHLLAIAEGAPYVLRYAPPADRYPPRIYVDDREAAAELQALLQSRDGRRAVVHAGVGADGFHVMEVARVIESIAGAVAWGPEASLVLRTRLGLAGRVPEICLARPVVVEVILTDPGTAALEEGTDPIEARIDAVARLLAAGARVGLAFEAVSPSRADEAVRLIEEVLRAGRHAQVGYVVVECLRPDAPTRERIEALGWAARPDAAGVETEFPDEARVAFYRAAIRAVDRRARVVVKDVEDVVEEALRP